MLARCLPFFRGVALQIITCPADGRKSITRIGQSLLKSAQFQVLSTGARYLYLCMATESKGKRDFTFPLSAAKAYGFSESSFLRWVYKLKRAGFAAVNSGANVRTPNKYSFLYVWREGRK